MRRIHRLAVLCALSALLAFGNLPVSAAIRAGNGGVPPATDAAATTPGGVLFVENVGQFDPEVRYRAWGAAGDTWLAEDGEHTVGLTLSFVGADTAALPEGMWASAAQMTYVVSGADPGMYVDVPVWAGVRTVDLYPGIDLVVTSAGGQIVRRLVVKGDAGLASLVAVRLRVEGAEALAVDEATIYATTATGEVALPLLEVVDEDGEALALGTSPAVAGNEIVAPFATEPVAGEAATADAGVLSGGDDLVYGNYVTTGVADDACRDLVVGRDGTAYAIGSTQGVSTGLDLIAQFHSPDGVSSLTTITWRAPGDDEGVAVVPVDDGGFYLAGTTTSDNFLGVLPAGHDGSHNGGADVFVVKFSRAFGFDAATYVGGTGDDVLESMVRGEDGALYLTGHTNSSDFPASSGPGYDTTADGSHEDAFVVKLTSDLSTVTYATYLGGSADDAGMSIAVDGEGAAYVAGTTASDDFPATGGAYQTAPQGGEDAFVAKVAVDGLSLEYATYLGGAGGDQGAAIAVDRFGVAYVAGDTASADFPAASGPGYDTEFGGATDGYVAKLAADGAALEYATYIGGSGADAANDLAVNGGGAAYVTGATASADFPMRAGWGYGTTFAGAQAGYLLAVSGDGRSLRYTTFLQGDGTAQSTGTAVAVAGAWGMYVAGYTDAADFRPIGPGAFTTYGGGKDGFMARMRLNGSTMLYYPLLWQERE